MRLKNFVRLAGLAALALAGFEAYTRWPLAAPLPSALTDIPAATRTLVLVAHGSVDGDNPLFPAIVSRIGAQHAAAGRTDVVVRLLHWAPWSDRRLRAAATAERLGALTGEALAGLATLESLELVVHSSGAYLADALCEGYRNHVAPGRTAARVTTVFLDPFQLHGVVDWRHGARQHGRCADFALAVINTDDAAPATNQPLARAWNIDVSAHPGRATFPRNGHYWPLQYYLDILPGLARDPLPPDHARYPRGGLVRDP